LKTSNNEENIAFLKIWLIVTTGYQLVLPSGKKVGHRILVRYYRQSLTNRNNEKSVELVNRIKDKYRALGWSGPGTTGLLVL